jgi:hypothetical protein
VLSAKHIDQKLAISYMLSLPTDKAFATFKAGLGASTDYKRSTAIDYMRLRSIGSIGSVAGLIWSKREFRIYLLITRGQLRKTCRVCSLVDGI